MGEKHQNNQHFLPVLSMYENLFFFFCTLRHYPLLKIYIMQGNLNDLSQDALPLATSSKLRPALSYDHEFETQFTLHLIRAHSR